MGTDTNTGPSTESTDAIRAVGLALLMVVSVIGATVAFSGAAAAGVSTDEVTVTTTTAGEQANYTINYSVDASDDHNGTVIDFPDAPPQNLGSLSASNVTVTNVTADSTIGVNDVSSTTTGLQINYSTTYSNNAGSDYSIEITGVTNNGTVSTGNAVNVSLYSDGGAWSNLVTSNELSEAYDITAVNIDAAPASAPIIADGSDSVDFTVTLTDSNGDPVEGVTIISGGNTDSNVSLPALPIASDSNGEAIVSATLAESAGSGSFPVEFQEGRTSNSVTSTLNGTVVDYDGGDLSLDGQRIWQGETLTVGNLSTSSTVEVYRVTERANDGSIADSEFQFERVTTANGTVELNTSVLETGDYFLQNAGANSNAVWSVAIQDLSVSLDDGDVAIGDTEEIDIESKRGTFDMTVAADGLDDSELYDLFTDFTTTDDADGDDGVIQLSSVSAQTYDLEPTADNIDTGEYDLEFEVTDSGVTDSVSLNVTEAEAGSLDFATSSVEVAQGDVAAITVELDETDTGTLLIGDQSDDGYQANVSLTDDGDGQVTVYFNTYVAGFGSSNANADLIVWEDTSEESDVATLDNLDDDAQTVNGILDAGSYELAVRNSDDPQTTANTPDTVGSLYIQERSTDGVNVWTTSDANAKDVDSLETLKTAMDDDQMTEATTLANGDQLVAQVSASGLQGHVAFDEDDIDEDAVVTNFGTHLTNESAPKMNFALTLEQQNPGANTDANTVNFSDEYVSSNLTAYYDAANDDTYVVVDTEVIADSLTEGDDEIADGDEYELTLDVKDQRLLGYTDDEWDDEGIDLYESATTEFSFEDPTVSFDTSEVDGDDYVTVAAAAEQTISGSTNVAPGTELTIRATGSDEARFVKTDSEVVVQPDGTFNGAFDFSDRGVDEEFTARASGGSLNALDRSDQEADGLIVEAVEETTTTEETTDETTTEETAEESTTEETTEETITEETTTEATITTSTQTPGFGIAVAMLALIGAALVALRRKD